MPQYPPYGQDQDVATTSSGLGAGAGDHLPVGDYSTMDYRSAMRFLMPSGWTAWTGITSATLKFYISDHQHVGPKNSNIFCSRMNVPVWSKAQGTQDCESGFSGSNTTQYADIASVSTDRISFSSGSTANAAKTLDVTAMVRYYWQNNSPLVFVFDNNGSDQYTEIWSLGKSGTTYDAVLTINYDVGGVPAAPTPTSPINSATVGDDTPRLSWTHDATFGPQTQAVVQLYTAAGAAIGAPYPVTVAGATAYLDVPVALTRGTTYKWAVRTSNAYGQGNYSAQQTFIVKANPVVTISTTRKMVMSGGLPRLQVDWTSSQPQGSYRVTASGYDSGVKSGSAVSHVLSTLGLTNGTAVTITVQTWNTDTSPQLTGSASRAFTPRWGLSAHKRTLAAVPVNWRTPVVNATVPSGASLTVEYGSAASAAATVPTAWYASLSSVPKTQYVHYRVWLLPSASTGPSLESIDIPYDSTVATVDKWSSARGVAGLTQGFAIDSGEYVYGSRALTCVVQGAGPYIVASADIEVKKGRSYILTGLMKTVGNAGAVIRLHDAATASPVLNAVGAAISVGAPADSDWFTEGTFDVNRYATPVWVAPADMSVYVAVRTGGTAGAQCWFDAIKLEESSVATAWSPSAIGATTLDAGGVQIDGTREGVFRYRGTTGGIRDVVSGGANGLTVGGDVDVYSPLAGRLVVRAQGSGADSDIHVEGPVGRRSLMAAGLTGDVAARAIVYGDATMQGLEFGAGNAVRDTNLYRQSANRLQTDDAFFAGYNTATNIRGMAVLPFVWTGTLAATGTVDMQFADIAAGNAQWRTAIGFEVIGISIFLSASRTGGTLSAQIYNASGSTLVGLAGVIDGTTTNLLGTYKTPVHNLDMGNGQLVRMRLTTAAFAPLAQTISVVAFVQFLNAPAG